jgi:hypothetical protein
LRTHFILTQYYFSACVCVGIQISAVGQGLIRRCDCSPTRHVTVTILSIAPIVQALLAIPSNACKKCRNDPLTPHGTFRHPSVSFKPPLLFSFKLMPEGKHVPSLRQAQDLTEEIEEIKHITTR